MVGISYETREATHLRLSAVIQDASLNIYPDSYHFREFHGGEFQNAMDPQALAIVRDGELWSQLVSTRQNDGETFAVFSFHFPEARDNSGFVGWLASHLKDRLGTGVFVICGYNSARGGVFDYWGCPAVLADELFAELHALIAGSDVTPMRSSY